MKAELLLRKCLWYSSWLVCLEKKFAFDAVMGVLGVLLRARFGGGVTAPSSSSQDGAGKDDILLLKGVPSGSKLRGGSLIGCRFFLLDCCTGGVLSCSEPFPTVKPRLCLIDPELLFEKPVSTVSFCLGSDFCASGVATGSWGAGWGVLIFDGAVVNVKLPRSGSLGDSYAFGMAGTGGTSSCSPPAELCTFRGFGAGSREPEGAGLTRRGIEDGPTFSEFKLELDESETPEAYDLRFCSGVARADEGVMLPPCTMAGDWLNARSSNAASAWGVGGPTGPPGGGWLGLMDSLRSLRASVGLMVLAPRPEMWGAADCRLLAEEGVYEGWAPGDLPGERALLGMGFRSGAMDETVRWPDWCLEGGWSDFALVFRVAVGSLGTPVVVVLRLAERVSRRLPLLREGARVRRGMVLSLAMSRSKLFIGSIPGPTLLRGGRAAGFGGAWAGN